MMAMVVVVVGGCSQRLVLELGVLSRGTPKGTTEDGPGRPNTHGDTSWHISKCIWMGLCDVF